MKSLCITGNTQYGVDQAAQLLTQAGASPALPAPRTPEVSMADWHQSVLSQFPGGPDSAQSSMGRVWDQLAGDIFLANRMQPLWFWADARSAALLDFWQGFDLKTAFILVYTDPATALERALNDGHATESQLDEHMQQWQQATKQMLRFHLRHPQRSLLLPDSADNSTSSRLNLLSERLGLTGLLTLPEASVDTAETAKREWLPAFMQDAPPAPTDDTESTAAPVTLVRHLISQYLEAHPEALAVHEETLACISDASTESAPLTPLSPSAALGRLMQERHEDTERLEARQLALQTSEAALQRAQADLANANDKIAALSKLEAQLKDSNEENELLLEQLHIVQEELEKAFGWKAKAEQRGEQLKKAEAELANAQAELKATKDKANALDAQLKKALEELKAANGKVATLTAQGGKWQVDMKAATDKVANLEAQLKKAQADLKNANEKLATEGKQKVSALESQLKDVNEENELLLEQLHLVQEELERYYLNLKQAEADKLQVERSLQDKEQAMVATVAAMEKRLSRVFARDPGYWDCEEVSVTPLPADGDTELAQWTLTGLETAGRYIPTLRFKTCLRQGAAGIIIQREGQGDAPLERWPASYAHMNELPCVAVAGSPLEGSNLALSSLSPADWEVLQNVVIYLVGSLDRAQPGNMPHSINAARLMRGLAQFAKTLRAWPNVMRFKQIEIAPVTSIPNYAGLSISLQGLNVAGQELETFSYRLASVDTVAGRFGQDPRLEFPESTRAALTSWFAESSDDRGARLELRFSQPAAFDTAVWNRLSHQDQSLVAALLTAMPMQLATLASGQKGTQEQDGDTHSGAGRTAKEWQDLSTWMTRTLANHLDRGRRAAMA